MRRSNPILTFALCTSLVVHLLGLSAIAWWVVMHTPRPNLAAIDRKKVLEERAMTTPPVAARRQPPPPPALRKPRPLPVPEPTDPHKDDSGEHDGRGTANRSTDGQKPMTARAGLEQADLMKATAEEEKLVDANSPLPVAAGAEDGENSDKRASSTVGAYRPDFVAESAVPVDPDADPAVPAVASRGLGPLPVPKAVVANLPSVTGATVATANAKPSPEDTPRRQPRRVRGHLATPGDTDSVALARDETFTFQAGRMVGRKGIKVNIAQPRYGMSSEVDLQAMGQLSMVVIAYVDTSGTVTEAVIERSSGSANVDQDTKRAIFDWTFEPAKDKDGHPKESTWTIRID